MLITMDPVDRIRQTLFNEFKSLCQVCFKLLVRAINNICLAIVTGQLGLQGPAIDSRPRGGCNIEAAAHDAACAGAGESTPLAAVSHL